MPTRPGLIVGVSRRFRSVACVHTAASPNEVRQYILPTACTIALMREYVKSDQIGEKLWKAGS